MVATACISAESTDRLIVFASRFGAEAGLTQFAWFRVVHLIARIRFHVQFLAYAHPIMVSWAGASLPPKGISIGSAILQGSRS